MEQISVTGTDRRTRGMRRLEERLSIDLESFLRRRYDDEGATQAEIASELSVDITTISRWMTRLGIETRLFASERAS
jgi:DNA invertase Pin-like site-specific DNA recombinase